MKRILPFLVLSFIAVAAGAQTTYYWVGAPGDSINLTSNWNTILNGSGSPRSGNTSTTDVLVFDGTNTSSVTPSFPVVSTASIGCGQLKFVNGASISLARTPNTGTTTITVTGDGIANTEDFLIESGCSFTLANGPGSNVVNLSANTNNSGRVSGTLAINTTAQAGIRNGTVAGPNLVFTSGSSFVSNLAINTPLFTASYPFGNSTQSTERWVTFQAGATLFYDGGYSPMASSATFQPVNFLPGSSFVMRGSNPTAAAGTFFNRKAYANITVLNGATATADGPVNRIDTLNITAGSTFTTHTSGQTAVLGNVIANGNLNAPAGSTNELMIAGNVPQSVSGIGNISLASLVVTDGADLRLERSMAVATAAAINGRVDFATNQLIGAATFNARNGVVTTTGTGNIAVGSYIIAAATNATTLPRGLTVSGAGLQPGTRIVGFTTALDSIYISRPATATATGVALSYSSSAATLVTANANGFGANGSVALTGNQTFNDGINYTFNATTATPYGLSTGTTMPYVNVGNLLFNSPITTNATAYVFGNLQAASGKVTIRPQDSILMINTAVLNGTYNSSTYFVTDKNAAGQVGVFGRFNITGQSLFPIGSPSYYLPATVTPTNASNFYVNVFEGITTNGTPTGTAFTSAQKQTVVDAVWNVNRQAGTGDARLQLQWVPVLEGTTLATFANDQIGIIRNTGSAWTLPFGVGDNAANTADTLFSTFGAFSVGARPPANPFVFNALPPKTYGDPDFSPGVVSANTASTITYTSSNTTVATIVGGNTIHITGVGTTTITAQQPSDGFYPAANISQTLTVSKAPLTIKADRKTKPQGDPNPPLTVTYTGFVLGEGPSVFTTPLSITTTATTNSLPGSYPITVSGATATNYNITFVNDSLIVRPRTAQTLTFAALTTRTYGQADFNLGATSNNSTISITYTSSNPAVATIIGANTVRIVGAGTTTITASQAGSDLFFAATPVAQTLVVNKAALTIRVADTTKNYGEPNPPFRVVYTGFVLGEGPAVFTTPLAITTTATTNSAPGYYAITPSGATAANYAITFVPGRLTIFPVTGTARANLQAFFTNANTLTVRFFSPEPDLGDVFIYDLNGRLMAKRNLFLAPGFVTTTFTLGNLPAGAYVVQVRSAKFNLRITTASFR